MRPIRFIAKRTFIERWHTEDAIVYREYKIDEADNFACLSFRENIRPWLVRCGEIAWQTPAVAETIQQYIHLIDKLTQSNEGDPFMEIIQRTVGMSQANYEAAVVIERSLEPLRAEMMRQIFREIETHLGNRHQKYNSSYEADAEQFYSSNRKKVWPSLTYLVKQCGDLNIAFRVEADGSFVAALYFLTTTMSKFRDGPKS